MRRGPRTLLGFDYGKRRIGVAVGQELTRTATPLETLKTVKEQPDWQAITRLLERWKPDALVVGIPLNMDGSEQEMTHAAKRFANRLRGRYHLPVYYADERLSSQEAANMNPPRTGAGGTRGGRSGTIDALAAQVILLTFFSQPEGWQPNGDGPAGDAGIDVDTRRGH